MIVLAIAGMLGLLVEILHPRRDNNAIVGVSVVGSALATLLAILQMGQGDFTSFAETIVRDQLALALQAIIGLGTLLVVLFSEPYLREKRIAHGEFYPLLLWSALGAMLLVSSTNLLTMFVGLEILSIALYVMAGLCRHEERSEESAIKYFLLGAFASCFLLYGIALLYGASGSLQLERVSIAWVQNEPGMRALVALGLAMVLVGLGFKSSFFPFHQWTPDVYSGAPTNVTAFMATVGKVGAFGALYRTLDAMPALKEIWLPALSVVAVATMLYGNLAALRQTDVKRILAYSSISHAGYVLVAILAHAVDRDRIGFGTLAYYLLSYTLMTIGAFLVVSLAASRGQESTHLRDLAGMWQRSPLAAASLVLFMASLIGLPLTSGFLGKSLIIADALQAGLAPLAVAVAVASIISVAYYLAIAYAAVVPDDAEADLRLARLQPIGLTACALCAIGVVGAFIGFNPVMNLLLAR